MPVRASEEGDSRRSFIAPNVAWSTQAALISATGSLPCNNTCAVISAVIEPAEAAPIESITGRPRRESAPHEQRGQGPALIGAQRDGSRDRQRQPQLRHGCLLRGARVARRPSHGNPPPLKGDRARAGNKVSATSRRTDHGPRSVPGARHSASRSRAGSRRTPEGSREGCPGRPAPRRGRTGCRHRDGRSCSETGRTELGQRGVDRLDQAGVLVRCLGRRPGLDDDVLLMAGSPSRTAPIRPT